MLQPGASLLFFHHFFTGLMLLTFIFETVRIAMRGRVDRQGQKGDMMFVRMSWTRKLAAIATFAISGLVQGA